MATAFPALPFYPAGVLNPVDWIGLGGNDFSGAQQSALMRGTPGAAWWQKKQIIGDPTIAQGAPFYLQSRPYDRGAGAFSPKFGSLAYNPIGSGVYAAYRLPTIAGPAARYMFGAIFFDVQAITTSIPFDPTIPYETYQALIATSSIGPGYATTG